MKRRTFLLSAAGVVAGNPLSRHIFAEIRTGEDRRNRPLASRGLSIRDGVKIAEECIVGAGALILRDTEKKGVYKGSDTPIAGYRSDELRRI